MIHSLSLSLGFLSQVHLWTNENHSMIPDLKWDFKGLIHIINIYGRFLISGWIIIEHDSPCLSSPCSSSELCCNETSQLVQIMKFFLSEYYIHIEHLHYLNLRYVKRRRSCLLHHKLPIFIIFIFRELLAIQNDSGRGFATAQPEKNPVMLNYNFFVCFLLFLEQ